MTSEDGGSPRFSHLHVRTLGRASKSFTPFGGGSTTYPRPVTNRGAHGQKLLKDLEAIRQSIRDVGEVQRDGGVPKDKVAAMMVAVARPNERVHTGDRRASSPGVSLLTTSRARRDGTDEAVYVVGAKSGKTLQDQLGRFIAWVEGDKPRNFYLFESVAALRPATPVDLWAGPVDAAPSSGREPCEVWVKADRRQFFLQRLETLGIRPLGRATEFLDCVVVDLMVSTEDVADLMAASAAVIEFRPASTMQAEVGFDLGEGMDDLDALVAAVGSPPSLAPRTVLLDTGISHDNPLLAPALPAHRSVSVKTSWGVADDTGHGTNMAGVALFGDVGSWWAAGASPPSTALESVKVLRPAGAIETVAPRDAIRAAVDLVEADEASVRRAFCLAATIPGEERDGSPSSTSAEIDDLCYGDGVATRLFCVSAGNVPATESDPSLTRSYMAGNEAFSLESPSQAMNALSVGAYTAKGGGATPMLAPVGDLSPRSRTSRGWTRRYANKPDVVHEGGNQEVNARGRFVAHSRSTRILTTRRPLPGQPLSLTGDTSAATAAVAGISTRLLGRYPRLRAETVRGLVVNSARWTEAMLAKARSARARGTPEQEAMRPVLDAFGWGVPDEDRLFDSRRNAVSLLVEDDIQPFTRRNGSTVLNELKYFGLPWPTAALQMLRNEEVELRCTLSYFAQPNPLADKRDKAGRYASHRLRFRLNQPGDTAKVAESRINKLIELGEEDEVSAADDGRDWVLDRARSDLGTVHQNVWRGPGFVLAQRGGLVVYPVKGWWAESSDPEVCAQRANFSLIVTLTTRRTDVDLYGGMITAMLPRRRIPTTVAAVRP